MNPFSKIPVIFVIAVINCNRNMTNGNKSKNKSKSQSQEAQTLSFGEYYEIKQTCTCDSRCYGHGGIYSAPIGSAGTTGS